VTVLSGLKTLAACFFPFEPEEETRATGESRNTAASPDAEVPLIPLLLELPSDAGRGCTRPLE